MIFMKNVVFVLSILAILSFLLFSYIGSLKREISIREPAVAGKFYPNSSHTLKEMINKFFNNTPIIDIPKIRGLISPHAGYIYSGQTAAYGYKQLNENYETIVIIGPSHHALFKGISIPNVTYYKTPLGLVKLSPKIEELKKEDIFNNNPYIHQYEHSIEVQLPFLQERLKRFEIIPILTGNVNPEDLADVLLKYIDDKTLVIASSDLSHYHPYDEARKLDTICTKSIVNLNVERVMKECEACGKIPILTLMYIAIKLGWKGKLLDYRNSGDTAGDMFRVVGYTSIAFFKSEQDIKLTKEEQNFLLSLARDTLNSYLKNGTIPLVNETMLTENLKKIQGCFVTLNKNGMLRGCIGHIIPKVPLYQCVIQNSISAALFDKRFPSVTYDELPEIDIEISVLTTPKRIEFNTPEELLNKLMPNKDGVVLHYKGRDSTYLPQVWELIPDKIEFLSKLCEKQGSPTDCWQKRDVFIEIYHAFVFKER